MIKETIHNVIRRSTCNHNWEKQSEQSYYRNKSSTRLLIAWKCRICSKVKISIVKKKIYSSNTGGSRNEYRE